MTRARISLTLELSWMFLSFHILFNLVMAEQKIIFDNELWTDYATLVCSHACDILSLNCLLVILFCSSSVCRCLLFVSLFRNTRFISQCGVCYYGINNLNRLWAQFTVPLCE